MFSHKLSEVMDLGQEYHRGHVPFSQHFACVHAQSCPTLCDPTDCGPPGSSVRGIFQAKAWSGLPFPSPGDLPDPKIEPRSPALQADSLQSKPPGNASQFHAKLSNKQKPSIPRTYVPKLESL